MKRVLEYALLVAGVTSGKLGKQGVSFHGGDPAKGWAGFNQNGGLAGK